MHHELEHKCLMLLSIFFLKVHFFLSSVHVGKLSWNEPPELLIPREFVLFPSPSRIPFIIALIIMGYAHGI